MGYDPVTLEVNVIPGGEQTVSLRLLHQRTVKQAAKLLYDQGVDLWERSKASPSDLRKAADVLARALKEDSSYSQAALALCRVQQAQDDTAAALKSCRRAIEIDPDYVEARSMAGVLLLESGDYPEAVRQLQQASTQDPQSTFVASLLAEALFLADRPRDAEEAANRAIKLDASSGQSYLIRGEARRMQKNFEGAIEDYRRAVEVQEFRSGVLRTAAFWAIGTGMRKHRSGTQFLYRSQKADRTPLMTIAAPLRFRNSAPACFVRRPFGRLVPVCGSIAVELSSCIVRKRHLHTMDSVPPSWDEPTTSAQSGIARVR